MCKYASKVSVCTPLTCGSVNGTIQCVLQSVCCSDLHSDMLCSLVSAMLKGTTCTFPVTVHGAFIALTCCQIESVWNIQQNASTCILLYVRCIKHRNAFNVAPSK